MRSHLKRQGKGWGNGVAHKSAVGGGDGVTSEAAGGEWGHT